MKQAVIKKGKVLSKYTPTPSDEAGYVRIKVIRSCISVGTEKMNVESSAESLFYKAKTQPKNVEKVLNSAKTKGLSRTIADVKAKLFDGNSTGYSISGVIVGVGDGVRKFQVGDRVAAGGAGKAIHAEVVSVPVNLVTKIPDELDFESASTVTLGTIALHGVRRSMLELGEFAVVYGTGVLGLITVQILAAKGVRVIAVDLNDKRLELARKSGAELVINSKNEGYLSEIENFTKGKGADAVIFTAATNSSEPLRDCFKLTRRKGTVVLVGVSGMNINRDDIYSKEIDFKISTSYGPGRYDRIYEEKGIDYPYSYVRWTQNRNMAEYLRLLNQGKVDIKGFVDYTFSVDEVQDAFRSLEDNGNALMVLLKYPRNIEEIEDEKRIEIPIKKSIPKRNITNVGIIGTGDFATNTHLPNLDSLGKRYKLKAICSRTALKGKNLAKRYGASYVTSDYKEILNDDQIDLVMILTRHDQHASLVIECLKAGKNVFVEKPLAINEIELNEIKSVLRDKNRLNSPTLFVGFNRRFSSHIQRLKKAINDAAPSPVHLIYNINAGFINEDSWVHEDGGRIIGEVCHFIDTAVYLTGSKVQYVTGASVGNEAQKYKSVDNKSIVLRHDNGSVSVINYFSSGNPSYSKEFLTVNFGGKTAILDDYRSLKGYGVNINYQTKVQSKGHLEELIELHESLIDAEEKWPISFEELYNITQASILAANL